MSNPYQLRYQILDLARTHLMEQYSYDTDSYRTGMITTPPTYPSVDQIFKMAGDFKSFVETP